MACLVLPQVKALKVLLYMPTPLCFVFTVFDAPTPRFASQARQSFTVQEFQRSAFAGEDRFSVDRLVESCQPKPMPALPSAGRELVPYFSSSDECVNETLSQSKADSARSVLSVTSHVTFQIPAFQHTFCMHIGKGKSQARNHQQLAQVLRF